jgi:hypothetical protein
MCRTSLTVLTLLVALGACDKTTSAPSAPTSAPPSAPGAAAAGMSKYPYVAADGGPHMLLPSGVPGVNYGSACAATANAQMAVLPAGPATVMVFQDPPLTAWGTSSDGLVEIYYLESWTSMSLDALVAKATAALPTASLTNSGKVFRLPQADAYLLFAGDTPTGSAYAVDRVTLPAGSYHVLVGTYSAPGESVTVYRLQPTITARPPTSAPSAQ